MKISLNWLREYVELPSGVPELADLLTRAGVEVEDVLTLGVAIPKVVVAQILESSQHPNADRLSVCKVDDGSGHPRQIVCGAKNYRVGDKVPLALPGSVLPGDFKIKVGKLRGVESEGMLCAADELGLPKGAEGLLILPADAPVGASLAEVFPGDTVLDLEITPNRPDLLGHTGMAREVAALTNRTLTVPTVAVREVSPAKPVAVDSPACGSYTLTALSGVKVAPSPDWLRQKLEAVGLRPINNIVDVTNYVLMETGQPLHAFDADKLNGDLCVRGARAGEEFSALDGRTYQLAPEDVVIADAAHVLALGGVMGGESSGVTEGTVNLLLESSNFDPAAIRRTSRRLGLSSDSSYRFERGIDPAGVLPAASRAVALILELAGGQVGETRSGSAGVVVAGGGEVPLRLARVNALLGVELPQGTIDGILSGFGLEKTAGGWQVPSFRRDLTREVDLIEEISRVLGMENIPGRLAAAPAVPGEADAVYDFQMEVRQKLVGLGLSEARTSTLVSESMVWQDAPALRLRNPLGDDQAYLRTSLLPGLLAAVERNIRQGAKTIALFELGRTFHASENEESGALAFVLHGVTASGGWRGEPVRSLDWHDAKGILESVLGTACVLQKIEARAPLALAARVLVNGVDLGCLGQLSPSAARTLDANGPVLTGEIALGTLRQSGVRRAFQDVPKFPAMGRDLALVCPLDLAYAEIEKTLLEAKEELLAGVEPFDVFTDPSGEKLSADRKSVAISLTFRAAGRTLNSEEVNAACERLRQRLKTNLAVDFR